MFLGTPFRGTKWQPFLNALAQLMGLAGSHRGITRQLGFDEPELRDKLHRFCKLHNKLSTSVSCFSELRETDYGRRFGIAGVAKGIVCKSRSVLGACTYILRSWTKRLLAFPASIGTRSTRIT